MSRGKIIAGIVGLIVVGVIVAGVVVSAQTSAPQVTTATAEQQTLGVTVTASGKVEAGTKGDVFPKAPGAIESVVVTEGAYVTTGAVLATLDPDQARLQVKQSYAALRAAQAQVEQVRNQRPSAADREAALAAIRAAEAGRNGAQSAYNAWVALFPGASGEPTTTNLRVALLNAQAGLDQAQAAYGKTNTSTNASLAAANAAVDQAEEAYDLAQQAVNEGALISPITGTVIFNPLAVTPGPDGTFPKAQKGAAVSPAAAPFTVVKLDSLVFNAQVDEADIDRVRVGMPGQVSLDAFPAESIDGTVTSIKPAAVQTTTGGIAFPVLLSLYPDAFNILLGMSGSVDIEVSAVRNAITVPIEALFDEDGNKYVFTYADGKVRKVKVTTGALTDVEAQIVSGLQPGTEVVVGNLSSLKDGMTVRKK